MAATFWIVAGASVGCSPAWHARDANHEVHDLLRTYDQRVLGSREQWVRQPEPAAELRQDASKVDAATEVNDDVDGVAEAEPLLLDLRESLRIAFSSGRDYLREKESLYLEGLGYSLTRHDFGPILNATISYLWSDAEDEPAGDTQTTTIELKDIWPSGAVLTADASLTGSRDGDPSFGRTTGSFLYDASATISLRQPLLRGAGYEVSHEVLTQAERDLIDTVRSFELFRQDYCIRVASAYYGLVSRKTRLANDEQNYRDAVFDRKKAEALRQVDRNQDDDVFLARRREIEAEDALLVARTDYRFALDDFKILLGLPTSTRIRIGADAPEFRAVRLDLESAVAVAQHNRLDLHTARDRLDDADRHVRVARNALLPDLDLTVAVGYDDLEAAPLHQVAPNHRSNSVGVEFGVPLDRKSERNAYRAALIERDRVARDLQRQLDEVERDVLNQLRSLSQTEKRIRLQTDQIEREKRAVAVTKIRYESGDADNRDLLDARQGLTNAQNALVELKVRHFIADLQLRRDLGILFIDPEGSWLP